jgi:hypothetical protein
MSAMRHTVRWAVSVSVVALGWPAGSAAQDPEAVSAKTWVGREAGIEAHLKTADILGLEDIPVGVTNPQAAALAPGGPVDKFAWKPLAPGIRRGFYESYKAEIAAYELDKLLGLGMVPVTVERRIRGELGAAVMWASPTQSFKELGGSPTPPTRYLGYWTIQLIRAKMFDNLINNLDPNEGNWLKDPAWNLILIDHSRSFTPDDDMTHADMTRVDRYLWERMQGLDESTLTNVLGTWLSGEEIRATLERRDRMGVLIDELVASDGEAAVLLRYGIPPGSAQAAAAPVEADLLSRLLGAANQAPLILPGSELTWRGTVVTLTGYQGPHAHIAAAGVSAGHRVGLLAEDGGLVCLAAADDPEPYAQLLGLVGLGVKIFGILADGTDMPLVQVTVSIVQ